MEKDPYSAANVQKISQLIGNYAGKHIIFHLVDEAGYPLTLIFREESLEKAGLDTIGDDVDIDDEILDELVETAINPALN